MQPAVNDAEQRAVLKFLEAVIRDAHYMADLTTAFLEAQSVPQRKNLASSGQVPAEDTSLSRRAEGVLLNLAAALRIASWERAGFRPALPADLPSSSEAFRNLVPPEMPEAAEGARTAVPELSRKVFRTWLRLFSRTSHATTLCTDVLLRMQTVGEDELLDALADFLWNNRHLAKIEER